MKFSESLLPDHILKRANLQGNEYAWRPSDIPEVIEAARAANLVSIGGQLQFRFPDGGTCECYWVDIDTFKSVPVDLPWQERVTRTADAALREFRAVAAQYDFLAEGRSAFTKYFEEFESTGGEPADAMCFVWYVESEQEAVKRASNPSP